MSARSVFKRMHSRLFSRLGEQAVLRISDPCTVNIEYNVVVDQESGYDKFIRSEMAATVDIANILSEYAPEVGDSLLLEESGLRYTLDAKVGDNGYMQRFVLLPA